ncbi:MAG TPA: succinate dehydrogenase assembly factor 2 [Stellaceae bacterium]|jgi:antitoxin CptB|nr:succinate dehydrogenase assembly factor 2 [Stellaceae bacterium]
MSISVPVDPQADNPELPPELRRRRLLFRSWHRGTREADLILGSFAEEHLGGFDSVQLDRYEALLEVSDADLFDWLGGRAAPPPAHDHDVTRLLLDFRYTPRAT